MGSGGGGADGGAGGAFLYLRVYETLTLEGWLASITYMYLTINAPCIIRCAVDVISSCVLNAYITGQILVDGAAGTGAQSGGGSGGGVFIQAPQVIGILDGDIEGNGSSRISVE